MNDSTAEFRRMAEKVLEALSTYVDQSRSGEGQVLKQAPPGHIARELDMKALIRNGMLTPGNVTSFLRKYLQFSQHMHHPHYIGHQVAVPHLSAGLADLIHGVINNPMAIYEMGPSASAMEKVVINWMLEKLGWFQAGDLLCMEDTVIGGGGVLTHGGSLANMTALLAARARVDAQAWHQGPCDGLRVLIPSSSHYSLSRAVAIMGLGADAVIPLEVDKNEKIIPDKVPGIIEDQIRQGRKIMALVANACATSTGLYDPLDEIADICREYRVWFHVDGAHGAGAILIHREKQLMNGIEKADSMIWDAHKMLRTSALCAAVLFRDHRNLDNTFRQKGDYIIHEKEKVGFDFMYNTVECTKGGLGPKVFWALAAEGEKAIADYIDHTYQQTKIFHKIIEDQPDFECPYIPESNILCFRYSGHEGNLDQINLYIRNKLTEAGDFYITSTTINGVRYLRLTVMNPLTESGHIKKLLDRIREMPKEI